MTIEIEDLTFKCIIGLLDFERITPQEVIVNLSIDYNYINEFINYAQVAQLIKKHLLEKKYELLENALENLFNIISQAFPLIEKLHIKITKPNILPNCRVSVSNIKVY
ncbi:dihydroneopterin aldolase [Sulfurimonas sp. MAG313]|nr:dihydroneopterin aldolase [Sulfurimonas sp. MAG313]MDF1880990.1 dihydroneopterin aldolase [Sulfurimonas sp. MAG313]